MNINTMNGVEDVAFVFYLQSIECITYANICRWSFISIRRTHTHVNHTYRELNALFFCFECLDHARSSSAYRQADRHPRKYKREFMWMRRDVLGWGRMSFFPAIRVQVNLAKKWFSSMMTDSGYTHTLSLSQYHNYNVMNSSDGDCYTWIKLIRESQIPAKAYMYNESDGKEYEKNDEKEKKTRENRIINEFQNTWTQETKRYRNKPCSRKYRTTTLTTTVR